MFTVASLAILVVMGMVLARAVLGPHVYDRILAVNSFGTLTDRPEFLDISLVYALINFIGTVAVTKYVRYSHLSSADEERDWEDV